MNYLTYGTKGNRTLLFIHGMASTALLCFEPLLKYFTDYYVVLAEVDGHSRNVEGELDNLNKSCDDIERYIMEHFQGHIYGLCGFSMGATMSIELISRGNIDVDKVVLDGAFTVNMGMKTRLFENCFTMSVKRIQQGKKIPKFLMDYVMGKNNSSVVDMLYQDVTTNTIINVCEFVYKYDIPFGLKQFNNPILFLRGSREKYPQKSAILLRKYLPQMEERVFNKMGHGQYLHEHSSEYAKELIEFLTSPHVCGDWKIKNIYQEGNDESSTICR